VVTEMFFALLNSALPQAPNTRVMDSIITDANTSNFFMFILLNDFFAPEDIRYSTKLRCCKLSVMCMENVRYM